MPKHSNAIVVDERTNRVLAVLGVRVPEMSGVVKRINRESKDVRRRLSNESDRGAVLIVAAHCEQLLVNLLRLLCASDVDSSLVSSLIDSPEAALGTFRARSLAAYAFGLLPEHLFRNLEQLRKARNHCAHHVMDVDFSDQKLRAHLMNLEIPFVSLPTSPPLAPDEEPIIRLAVFDAMMTTWASFAVECMPLAAITRTRLAALWPDAPDISESVKKKRPRLAARSSTKPR